MSGNFIKRLKKRLLIPTLTIFVILSQVTPMVAIAATNENLTDEDTIETPKNVNPILLERAQARQEKSNKSSTTNTGSAKNNSINVMEEELIEPDISKDLVSDTKSVKISHSKLTVGVGDQYTLNILNTKSNVSWKSNKTAIVKISAKGKITAIKPGSATITAALGKKTFACKVTVLDFGDNIPNISTIDGYNNTTALLLAREQKVASSRVPYLSLGSLNGYFYFRTTVGYEGIYGIELKSGKTFHICPFNNTISNYIDINNGRFVLYEDRIYYIDKQGYLIQAKNDNSNQTKLTDFVIDGFYVDEFDGESKIFMIRNNKAYLYSIDDGSLNALEGTFFDLAYTKDDSEYYYFAVGTTKSKGGVYAVDKKTGKRTTVSEFVCMSVSLSITKNYSYYFIQNINGGNLKYSIEEKNGKIITEIIEGGIHNSITHYGGYEYFREDSVLYRIKEGTTNRKVIHTSCKNYNIINNKIYVFSYEGIIKMDLDGKNKKNCMIGEKYDLVDKLGGMVDGGGYMQYYKKSKAEEVKNILLKTKGYRIGDSRLSYFTYASDDFFSDKDRIVMKGEKSIIRDYQHTQTYGGTAGMITDLRDYRSWYDAITVYNTATGKGKMLFEVKNESSGITILGVNSGYVIFYVSASAENDNYSTAELYRIKIN